MPRLETSAASTNAFVRWGGPALAAAGIAVYVWYSLQAPPARGIAGFAVVSGVRAYDLSLPLLGAGLLLARLDAKAAITSHALFAVILIVFVLAGGPLAQWLATTPGAIERFVLVGPVGGILAGTALVLSDTFRRWLAPLAMVVTGGAFGVSIRLFDPTAGDRRFSLTLVLVALWLVTVPFLLGCRHRKQWFAIVTRIVGSWLIAIGMLLGALLILAESNRNEQPSPVSQLTPDSSVSQPLSSVGPRDRAVDAAPMRA